MTARPLRAIATVVIVGAVTVAWLTGNNDDGVTTPTPAAAVTATTPASTSSTSAPTTTTSPSKTRTPTTATTPAETPPPAAAWRTQADVFIATWADISRPLDQWRTALTRRSTGVLAQGWKYASRAGVPAGTPKPVTREADSLGGGTTRYRIGSTQVDVVVVPTARGLRVASITPAR